MKEFARRIVKFILRILVIIVYRPKTVGVENIPEGEGALICPNHVHGLDSAVIVLTNKRIIRVLAKESLFKNPILRWLASIFGVYPVKLGNKSMEAMKMSLKILKSNELLLIFPEGTRNGMEKGEKAKDGAAFFAVRTGAKVIPVGISGGEKPFKKMYIKYGQPLDFSNRSKDELDQVTDEIMEKIVELAK